MEAAGDSRCQVNSREVSIAVPHSQDGAPLAFRKIRKPVSHPIGVSVFYCLPFARMVRATIFDEGNT
jgi:hypothetical protein